MAESKSQVAVLPHAEEWFCHAVDAGLVLVDVVTRRGGWENAGGV